MLFCVAIHVVYVLWLVPKKELCWWHFYLCCKKTCACTWIAKKGGLFLERNSFLISLCLTTPHTTVAVFIFILVPTDGIDLYAFYPLFIDIMFILLLYPQRELNYHCFICYLFILHLFFSGNHRINRFIFVLFAMYTCSAAKHLVFIFIQWCYSCFIIMPQHGVDLSLLNIISFRINLWVSVEVFFCC